MTLIQVGVRDFTKDFNKFQNSDIVEILDKKTNQLKGIYLSFEMAQKVKNFLEEEKKEKLSKIMKYAGKIEVKDEFKNLSKKEIKEKIAKMKNE